MFRTELPLTPHPHQLPLSARVLTIGSCFSDTIGSRLADFKVATMVNPFGTVFNPISLCKLLRAAAGEDMDWQQHLVEARGRWQSYDLHAELGAESPVELLQRIQGLTREVGVFLATADTVVLTLGTAYAYRLRETQEIVSNCHKLPAEKFEKELLTADDIIAAVAETHAYLRRVNPRLRFILTVSPVRHLKDTLVLNSASKAMLRVACHYLSELLPDVSYFPAYELLVDDLRDYRFYAADMLHPSEVAENYIWERFTRTYFDAAFGRFKKEWEGIRQALNHRPLYAAAPEHRQFLESTLERLRRLGGQADVRMELLHLERELSALPLPPPPPAPEPEEIDDEERIDIGDPEEADEPTARLVEPGAGLLIEAEMTDDETEEEISPESAYEHAYTAGLEEDDDEEAAESATDTEEPVRRKKRRSRGGAKRTKRKHARLAAEAEAAAQQSSSATPSEAPAEHAPTAGTATAEEATDAVATEEGSPEVVYVTEAQLRQPRATSEPAAAPFEAAQEVTEPTADASLAEAPKRSRNNRRGNRAERPAREAGRNARRPLYAAEAPEAETSATADVLPPAPAETPAPEIAPVPAEAPARPEAPAAEVSAALEASSLESAAIVPRKAPARTRPSRSKKITPATPEAASPEAATTAPAPAAPAAAETPATPTPEAKPAKSRRRPTATAAPAEAAAELPVAPAEPAAQAPKRAARKKAAPAPAAVAPEPVNTPEPAEATPKRRARPPRRKPATDTPPENV